VRLPSGTRPRRSLWPTTSPRRLLDDASKHHAVSFGMDGAGGTRWVRVAGGATSYGLRACPQRPFGAKGRAQIPLNILVSGGRHAAGGRQEVRRPRVGDGGERRARAQQQELQRQVRTRAGTQRQRGSSRSSISSCSAAWRSNSSGCWCWCCVCKELQRGVGQHTAERDLAAVMCLGTRGAAPGVPAGCPNPTCSCVDTAGACALTRAPVPAWPPRRWRNFLSPDIEHPRKSPFSEWEVAVVVQVGC
jgi:hypothetical protein